MLVLAYLLADRFLFQYQFSRNCQTEYRCIQLEVVDSEDRRERGLSNRENLARNQGMLFIFDSPDEYCFWMKDMKFPIDIIWLDSDKKIVGIEHKVSPDTYPKSFCPSKPSLYVIEVEDGLARRARLKLGQQINF